jgi:hypothetical protein
MVARGLLGVIALGLLAAEASAQAVEQTSFLFRRPACDSCRAPVSGPITVTPSEAEKTDVPPMTTDAQAFAQAPAAGGEAGLSFNPAMFGDLGAGRFSNVIIRFNIITTTQVFVPGNSLPPHFITVTTVTPGQRVVQVPIIGAGAFKISDNESPRPTDRVWMTYNYYDRVNVGGTSAILNREMTGFEKTFLGGNASLGMRLPFLQTSTGSDLGVPQHEVGDITFVSKYALINESDTVLSGGLTLTVPSADHSVILADGTTLHSVLCQPYACWLIGSGNFYAQGFHAVVVPTDSRDVASVDNDIGIGYWFFRTSTGFLRGVVPTIEAHVYMPLNHTNEQDLIFAPNICTLTWGVNFVLPGYSTLGCGVAAPVTGPRPNNIEAMVSFNLRF